MQTPKMRNLGQQAMLPTREWNSFQTRVQDNT
jgi:hypothetical protein